MRAGSTAGRALFTILLVFAASSPSAADGAAFHAPLPVGGPGLAGGAPVWAERQRDHSVRIRRRDPASHRIRTVLSGPANEQEQLARIAGSDSTLAVEIISGGFGSCFENSFCIRDVFGGPAGGRLRSLQANCELGGATELPAALDVSGTQIVYADCPIGPPDITDERTGATSRSEGGWRGLRIAGRYIAWVSGNPYGDDNTITVYDWKRKSAAYVVQRSMTNGSVGDFDLARDGTVVFPVVAPHQESQLGWVSPASRSLHRIPVPPRDRYHVRLVGGKIVFEGGREAINVPRAQVGVSDLAGHVRILATGAYMGSYERQFDFDGRRVAWYAFACTGARMHVQQVDSGVVHESLARCPLRLKRPPRIRQDRFVDLSLDCYGYAQGCRGRNVVLRLKSRPDTVVGRGDKAHNVTLTEHGMELLRQRDKLRVRARVTMTDLAGTRERRSGSLTLVRP